jgi:hypothetical protein
MTTGHNDIAALLHTGHERRQDSALREQRPA